MKSVHNFLCNGDYFSLSQVAKHKESTNVFNKGIIKRNAKKGPLIVLSS